LGKNKKRPLGIALDEIEMEDHRLPEDDTEAEVDSVLGVGTWPEDQAAGEAYGPGEIWDSSIQMGDPNISPEQIAEWDSIIAAGEAKGMVETTEEWRAPRGIGTWPETREGDGITGQSPSVTQDPLTAAAAPITINVGTKEEDESSLLERLAKRLGLPKQKYGPPTLPARVSAPITRDNLNYAWGGAPPQEPAEEGFSDFIASRPEEWQQTRDEPAVLEEYDHQWTKDWGNSPESYLGSRESLNTDDADVEIQGSDGRWYNQSPVEGAGGLEQTSLAPEEENVFEPLSSGVMSTREEGRDRYLELLKNHQDSLQELIDRKSSDPRDSPYDGNERTDLLPNRLPDLVDGHLTWDQERRKGIVHHQDMIKHYEKLLLLEDEKSSDYVIPGEAVDRILKNSVPPPGDKYGPDAVAAWKEEEGIGEQVFVEAESSGRPWTDVLTDMYMRKNPWMRRAQLSTIINRVAQQHMRGFLGSGGTRDGYNRWARNSMNKGSSYRGKKSYSGKQESYMGDSNIKTAVDDLRDVQRKVRSQQSVYDKESFQHFKDSGGVQDTAAITESRALHANDLQGFADSLFSEKYKLDHASGGTMTAKMHIKGIRMALRGWAKKERRTDANLNRAINKAGGINQWVDREMSKQSLNSISAPGGRRR